MNKVEPDFIFQLFLNNPVITTDSRTCSEGSIFFAIKGENFNGNQFASKALEAGCAYAVVDEPQYADNEKIFFVENCLETLQKIATLNRKRCFKTKYIGITGTNGKTTTKEMIATALKCKYNIVYTQGNLNNQIGVPLTMLRVKPDTEIAIIEMGSNHHGEINQLASIVDPNYGIITNIGKGHVEGFGSYEGVATEKRSLYKAIDNSCGTIFVNCDDEFLMNIAQSYDNTKKVFYGTSASSSIKAKPNSKNEFLSLLVKDGETERELNTNLVGDYNFPNVMVALAVGNYFDIEISEMIDAISKYVPQNNRSQFIQTKTNHLIVDAYNANPSSMCIALDNIIRLNTEKKAVILGDMKELGPISKAEHANIVNMLKTSDISKVFLVGPNFAEVADSYPCFADANALAEQLKANPISGYTILLKGSNSMKIYTLAQYL